MDLAAIDEEDQVDYEKVIAEAIVAYNAPDEMNLQASILALDALGLFADNLSPEDAGGQGINASDTEDSDESETDVAEEETDTSESDAVNNDESEENEPEVDEGESYDESETESVNNDESEGDETEATDDEGAEEDADTEDDEESYAEDTDTDEDSGYGYNLVETLYNSEISASTLSGKAFKLLVSWYYGNPDEEDGSTEWRDLVDDIIALQNEDGGWSSSGIVSDVTATALVLTALAPCREHDFYDSDWEIYDEAEQAVQKGLEALKKMQLSNGGFASTNNPEEIDVNTTATVIIALAATGTDAETWKVEATPLAALLSQANEAKDGFLYDGKTDDIVTELGFRALVAYQGYLNAVWIAEQYNSTSDSSCYYNIYLSAWRGSAGLEPPEIWTVPPDASAAAPPPDASAAAAEAAKAKGSGNAASKPKDTSTSKEEDSGDKSSLPATGDSSALMLAVFSLIVLSALVCFARYRVLRRYH
jgi:hypothetical protein